MKLLLYCTKGKEILWWNKKFDKGYQFFMDCRYNRLLDDCPDFLLNGKIVAECDYEMEEIVYGCFRTYGTWYMRQPVLLKKSCLDFKQMQDYLGTKQGYCGYVIYIKNLHIFDEPKELDDYKIFDKSYENCFAWAFTEEEKNKPVTKAPQNMMYVFDGNEKKVLISIHPEHLCKILNGEKTIEVRKKVLNEM